MRRLALVAASTIAVACASHTTPSSNPTPANPPPGAPPPAPGKPAEVVRFGPSSLRYVAHQVLHAEQQLGTQTQVITRGTQIFLTATIVGPADSLGYRWTVRIDSIALDSGTTLPPGIDLAAARGLVYDGRLMPSGTASIGLASDSARAAPFEQLLGLLDTFYPRLPIGGVVAGSEWTDTTARQDRVVIDATRRSVNQSRAGSWEDRGGIRALRVDVTSTYTIEGSGTQRNQPVQVKGSGIETLRHFLAADGRYLGAEGTDSSKITVTFPYQTVEIPAIRILRTTVIAQP
ncbi:MAG: hypothetical protein ACM358_04875 [Gemmatimonadota bacterium]